MAEDTRIQREMDSRDHDVRDTDDWVPPSVLPKPNPKPGMNYRWVRTSTLGKADVTNVSQKLREGWVPVKASEHPELAVMSDLDTRFEDSVEIGGLLLCTAPTSMVERRARHFNKVANQQMEAVDHSYMAENDPRMPLLQSHRDSQTQFGKG